MKNLLASTVVLIGFLVAMPRALPQAPKKPSEAGLAPIPGSLEEMLAVALRSNPDILLAEAKVREAQATLNAARLKVTQDVVKTFHERSRQENVIMGAKGGLERINKLNQTGQVTVDEVDKAKILLIDAQIGLRQWEAQVRYLLGLGGSAMGAAPADGAPAESPVSARRPEMPKQMEELLTQTNFNIELSEPRPLTEVLKIMRDFFKINILLDKNISGDEPIQLPVKGVPFLGALLALTDMSDDLCFVVRDYGLLLTTRGRAQEIYAPTIPPDVFLSSEVVPSK